MLEDRIRTAPDGRPAKGKHRTQLARIQEALAKHAAAARSRRCPCCGKPIRATQRVTTIHGTSVHVHCASKRSQS
ncbi:MAG TPA: hypothetical protein VG474_08505 [Solirubrobacteraceae bacterium]|nr:hypothetical protein [Solirubrobacteraceae bacterium]